MTGLLFYIMFGLLAVSCAGAIAEDIEEEFGFGEQLVVFFLWALYLGWILGSIAVDTTKIVGWRKRKTGEEEASD